MSSSFVTAILCRKLLFSLLSCFSSRSGSRAFCHINSSVRVAFYSASCCKTKQKYLKEPKAILHLTTAYNECVSWGRELLMAPSWCKGQRLALIGVRTIIIKLWSSTFRRGEPWGMQDNFKMPNFSRTNDLLKNVWSCSGISSEDHFSKREEPGRDFCLASACFCFLSSYA